MGTTAMQFHQIMSAEKAIKAIKTDWWKWCCSRATTNIHANRSSTEVTRPLQSLIAFSK
jgi:hypothetical protein